MTDQRSPTEAELLRMAVNYQLQEVYTTLPGRVERYDAKTQRADIKPLVKRTVATSDGGELVEELPVLTNVKIAPSRGGGFFQSFPVKKGDFVTVFFAQRSIDSYMAGSGNDTDPGDFRMHDISDGFAVTADFSPFSKSTKVAHAENMVMGKEDGSTIHIKPSGEVHLAEENAADFVALAALVKSEINALQSSVSSMVTTFNAHIHPAPGGATLITTTPQTSPAAVGDVKAEKVKAT